MKVAARLRDGRRRYLLAPAVFLLLSLFALLFRPVPSSAEWEGGHCAAPVPAASTTWFFAEGCTRPGFEEWVCVLNQADERDEITFRFLLPAGEGTPLRAPVAPHSRLTLYVNHAVGSDQDVSVIVESRIPVVAERSIYFRYGTGGWAGGHCEQGSTATSTNWYFAEGCTRPGFDTWLCLANPQPLSSEVRVDFLLGSGQGDNSSALLHLAPGTRCTLRVNDYVPPSVDVSMVVASQQAIVAERPIYFVYRGTWDGGHVALGTTAPSTSWYFAEGCTRPGFDTWLCLLNPGREDALARIHFMTDTGESKELEIAIPASRRFTVYVNEAAGEGLDVSCEVASSAPLVVERPLYFVLPGGVLGGHITAGMAEPVREMFFAEGCTLEGFHDFLCVVNPHHQAAEMRVTFMDSLGNTTESHYVLAPRTRLTLDARDVVGPGKEFSTRLSSNLPLVAERPLYFSYMPMSRANVAAVGDVNLDLDQFDMGYGYDYPWTAVAGWLRSADLAFANLECAVSWRGSPVPGKGFTFRGSPAALPTMREAGVDVVSHANNHSRDYGGEALVDTLAYLDANGIAHCGSGADHKEARSPAFLTARGLRVAFLAYSDVNYYGWPAGPGYPGVADASDAGRLVAEISSARERADLVVVSFHWGIEKEYTPTSRQRFLAHLAVDSGADLVVGHHPHVVQGLEIYKDRLIAYSLGNFAFNPGSVQGTYSALLLATLGCGGFMGAIIYPIRILNGRPTPMTGTEANSWLRQIASLSASLGTQVTLHGDTATIP